MFISLEGNHDRAWNDPPVFAYSAATGKTEDSNPRRTLLNKRVAFPLSGGIQPSAPFSAGCPPPIGAPPTFLNPIPHPVSDSSVIADDQPVMTEGGSLEKIKSVLEQKTIGNYKLYSLLWKLGVYFQYLIWYSVIIWWKAIGIGSEPLKLEDIGKRLQSLFSCWEDGKLNVDVKGRLVKLCNYLEEGDFAGAESVQIALAVDYTSECATWILAIKYIISEIKNK